METQEKNTASSFTAIREADGDKRKFSAGEFEGPLDLLWYLIHKSEINIYDIPIAEITEQYLEYLDYAVQTDLGDLSEFYRWAAMLLCMKSRMLLPVEIDYEDEEIEDPRQELVDKLIEYQKFKKLSELMEKKEDDSEWTFERSRIQRVLPFEDRESDWEEVDTWELLLQMQKMFKSMMKEYSNDAILNMYEEISVNEKITLICAFMAILEAVKFKLIRILQNRIFGDIKLIKRGDADMSDMKITVDTVESSSEEQPNIL